MRYFKKFGRTLFVLSCLALAAVPFAGATAYNLDGASTAVQSQFTASLPAVLTVGGALLGVAVAWRFIRRMVKA
jgi:hypothetical protein